MNRIPEAPMLRSVYRPRRECRIDTVVSGDAWAQEYELDGIRMKDPYGLKYAIMLTPVLLSRTPFKEGWVLTRSAEALRRAVESMNEEAIGQNFPGEKPTFVHRWDAFETYGEGYCRSRGWTDAWHDIIREDGRPW